MKPVQHVVGSLVAAPTVATGAHLALLVLLAEFANLGLAGWVAGTVYAGAVWALLARALRRAGTRSLAAANQVTLARATLVGGVTALVANGFIASTPAAPLVVLATLAALLDAVDGQVARRTGTASPLGARFDMEVDTLLLLVLSVSVAQSLGAWVLAIGLMRYVFAAAGRTMPWLRTPLPSSTARKAVAALQAIVLIVASTPLVVRPVATLAVAAALALLTWSFARDTSWLWQHARSHR